MAAESEKNLRLEIGHVLFIDLVGYSQLLIEEQNERFRRLTDLVLATAQVREATNEQLVRLPTGDGMALVFRNSPEEPANCALELAQAVKEHPELKVRMGIHSGPVSEVTDVNGHRNIAGAGVNMAQRVMDCADAGHILLSQHVADDLAQYRQWSPRLHRLGECEVKHGMRVSLVNLYTGELGNPAAPAKFQSAPIATVTEKKSTPKYPLIFGAIAAALALGFVIFLFARKGGAPVQRADQGQVEASVIPEKSVAVLPFENLSEEKANAFFAVGVQDEILTRLAKIGDLKVISRTSTARYQSKPESLSGISQQLGVANILEGSVQKSGDAVHINVQLIKAATNAHLWAESYDRELKNIFSVEGEVAGAIAEALNAKLTGSEKKAIAEKPTQNTEAYDAYLRGLSFGHDDYGISAYQRTVDDLAEAVRLDPHFALAWAGLASARSFLYFNGVAVETNTPAAVKEEADRAMALAPEAGESWIALGVYRYHMLRDFSGALEAYEKAQQLLPNSSQVLTYIAVVERRIGRWQEAEGHFKKALELDPRNVQLLNIVGAEVYYYLRRYDDAAAMLHRALQISPDSETSRGNLAALLLIQGRLAESAQELAHIPASSTDDFALNSRITHAFYERHFDAAIKVIEQRLTSSTSGQRLGAFEDAYLVNLGYAQEWLGQKDEARRAFERAVQEIKPSPDSSVPLDANGTRQTLALAYAGLNEKEKALQEGERAVQDYAGDAVSQPFAEIALAQIQARFGDFDAAIASIQHLLKIPAGITPASLRLDPFWDPLRSDPRFQALCQGK